MWKTSKLIAQLCVSINRFFLLAFSISCNTYVDVRLMPNTKAGVAVSLGAKQRWREAREESISQSMARIKRKNKWCFWKVWVTAKRSTSMQPDMSAPNIMQFGAAVCELSCGRTQSRMANFIIRWQSISNDLVVNTHSVDLLKYGTKTFGGTPGFRFLLPHTWKTLHYRSKYSTFYSNTCIWLFKLLCLLRLQSIYICV